MTNPGKSHIEELIAKARAAEATREFFGDAEVEDHGTYLVNTATGEIRENYLGYEVKTLDGVSDLVALMLAGKVKPHEAHALALWSVIDLHKEKITVENRLYHIMDREYDFSSPEHFKSTFSMTKLENMLCSMRGFPEGEEPEFKKLLDRYAMIKAIMSCLEVAREFIKMTERSSWGYRANRGD